MSRTNAITVGTRVHPRKPNAVHNAAWIVVVECQIATGECQIAKSIRVVIGKRSVNAFPLVIKVVKEKGQQLVDFIAVEGNNATSCVFLCKFLTGTIDKRKGGSGRGSRSLSRTPSPFRKESESRLK